MNRVNNQLRLWRQMVIKQLMQDLFSTSGSQLGMTQAANKMM